MKPKEVRPLIPSDHSEWKKLWRGYIDFYKAEPPEEMYVITWERILDENLIYTALVRLLEVNCKA